MAIYYINPHTTTNGTGTFASPWSLSAAHTGLVSGDEIRILGVALTSLLTATSYTATVTSNYQLTITAGGGLGADWAVNDVAYLPAFDTFFKVGSVTTNVIALIASTSMLPINNSSTASVTLRKVNLASYPVSSTGNYTIGGSYTTVSNITVSDCWTDATTRVTDGTVKTLFNSSATGSITCTLDTTGATSTMTCTNWTFNLQNTCIMCSNGTSGTNQSITSIFVVPNSTINIGQIFNSYYIGGGLQPGSTIACLNTGTVNVTTMNGPLFTTASNAKNLTVNATNAFQYYADYILGSSSNISNLYNFNITFENIIINGLNVGFLFSTPAGVAGGVGNITINGTSDMWNNATFSYLVYGMSLNGTVTLGPSFTMKYNKRASTQTTINNKYYINYSYMFGNKITVPTVVNSSSVTITNTSANNSLFSTMAFSRSNFTPNVVNIEFPTMPPTAQLPYGNQYGANVLVTTRDFTAPVEILSIYNSSFITSPTTQASYPNVSTDAAVYKTTGPSLKSYLATRSTSFWGIGTPKAIKTIKIPVVAGTSYTVSGYIRTDDAAYVNGDCRMAIIQNDAEVVAQNMTTACINAWEGFSLTFTASATCELNLAWQMNYRTGAKSYWLDDLTIV